MDDIRRQPGRTAPPAPPLPRGSALNGRLFVTGGSGFIGAELCRLARDAGLTVANYDRVPPRGRHWRGEWLAGDVRDAAALRAAVQAFAPDWLLHLASDVDITLTRPEQFTTTLDGTRNVIAAARALPRLRRLAHVSTQFVVTPGVAPAHERDWQPYTAYGHAKAATERLLWDAQLPMPWLILRPTVVWGPHHPSFAEHIFRRLRQGLYLHPGGVPIRRSFGYVTNVARQLLRLTTAPTLPADRHVYYVADDAIDAAQWVDAFALALRGRPARRVPASLLALLGRAGDALGRIGLPTPLDSGRVFRMTTPTAVDVTPTLALTGAGPVSFEQGVADTVAWLHTLRR